MSMITRMDLVDRLAAVTGDAASYDEVMTSVALIRAAINYLLPEPVGVDEAEREDVANFVHALPNGLWKDEVAVRIHARARAIERAVHADGARIAHLTHERDIARRDCAALQAEVEALRKRVLPEGWQAIDVAGLRAELMTQRDTTDTYGYSAETARVAIEGCIETLDEHAAAPQPLAAPAPAAEQPTDEREQFEAWAKHSSTPYDLRESKYIGNGIRTYHQDRTQWAFESFCGALRMRPAAAPAPAAVPAKDGWIENTGTQPVVDDVLVDIELANGQFEYSEQAGHWGWAKSDEYEPNIIRWRPAAPASEATANKEGA